MVPYSHADSVAVHSKHILLFEWLFDAKVLLNGHAVTQNYVFVVFQSEATENKSHDQLNKHVEETKVMKILKQLRTISTTWHICLTVWLRFVSFIQSLLIMKDFFFSRITLKLHIARNVFDCLLWVWGPGVMMVNIGIRDATMNIAFASSRNTALIERKIMQHTTISMKLHHCTLGEIKTKNFSVYQAS